MGEDGKVVYKVVIDDQGVEQEAEAAGQKAGQGVSEGSRQHSGAFKEIWIGAMREIGAAFIRLGGEAVNALIGVTRQAVDSVASLEQNVGGVETLFKDSADAVIANAERAYKTAGLSANQYMETVTSFSASLLQSLEGDTVKAAAAADQAVIDMADNANKMGTDMGMIQSAYQGFARQNYTMLDNLKLGYGGTKSEMERLIEDAEKLDDSFRATRDENGNLTMSFADITQAIHIVQDDMGITGTTAKEASETISGSVASMKAAWDNFLNGTITSNELADAIITAATNIVDNLGDIINRFSLSIPNLINALVDQIPTLASTVGPPLFSAVTRIIGELLNLLLDNIPNLIEGGVELLLGLLDGFTSSGGIANVMAAVLLIIRSLLNAIVTHLPEILGMGVTLLMQLLAGIGEAIPTLFNMIGELILNLINSFLHADWKSIGSNIVNGIWAGISGLWDSLVASVQQAVNELWGSVKKFFGIASPSKKFKYIGEMTTEGFIEGVEDTEAEMTRTVTDVYGGMADSAQSALTRDLGSLEQNVSYNLTAAGKAPDTTIVVPLTLDGREIARATAWSMGEQLAWEEMA